MRRTPEDFRVWTMLSATVGTAECSFRPSDLRAPRRPVALASKPSMSDLPITRPTNPTARYRRAHLTRLPRYLGVGRPISAGPKPNPPQPKAPLAGTEKLRTTP